MNDRQRGLYGKYRVERTDGSSGPGGKHEHCWYFVLDPLHDPHARTALAAYIESCRGDYPKLARDLDQALLNSEKEARFERALERVKAQPAGEASRG